MRVAPLTRSTGKAPSLLSLALCLLVPLIAVWLLDLTGFDLAVTRWYGTSAGFAWKDHVLLTQVFHVGIRRICVFIALYCIVAIWWPLGPWRWMTQRDRVWLACNIWLCATGVAALKSASLTSCPWDLAEFGDKAQYVWHFAPQLKWFSGAIADGGPGKCFPSGHASSFFSFLPLVWVVQRYSHRRAWQALAALCVFGLTMSWVQVMRGAHYPSHLLWTMWLCWALGTVTSPLLQPRQSTAASA
jgi:membrane-associated PAP2 superfamily phosphatase